MKHQLAVFCFSFLLLSFARAQEVPFLSDDPPVSQKMDFDTFDFISKTLGAARMGPGMKCTLRTRNTRHESKFSTGSEWVEVLEVEYNSKGYDSGRTYKFQIPMTAKYGKRKSTNQWSGVGEDFKIELGDYYEHWIKFTHDGQGRILSLLVGNRLATSPCQVGR